MFFTKNNLKKAHQKLEDQNYEIRRKDALFMSFFCGTITITTVMFVFILSIPDSMLNKYEIGSDIQIYSSLYTFRFFFMIIFLMFASGVVVKALRKYRINYMYIFELDPQYKITHIQLFKFAIALFAIWAFCLMG